MKVLIIFDTKHGNTHQVADLIADGINSVEGNETEVVNVKDFELNENKTYQNVKNSELSWLQKDREFFFEAIKSNFCSSF